MFKILIVSPQTEQSKGGMAIWTDTFLKACRQFHIDYDLLNIATIGVRAKQGNAKRNFRDEFIRTNTIFRNLHRMLKNQLYNVAHINTSCDTFGLIRDYLITYQIKKGQPSCKVVVHFHCDIQTQCRSKLSRFILTCFLKISDKALVLNERNQQYLSECYSIQSEVVANFVDADAIRIERKTIRSEIKEVIFVGYVRPEKGIKELYAVAQTFPKITFRLVGEVHDVVAQWDKPDNIMLCGKKNRDEVMLELDKADVFLFLSHSEGFSIALLESMARGMPCIATDVGANKEMLENKGGIIVPVGDVVAMIQALSDMQDIHMRERASTWNLQKVQDRYTSEMVIDKLRKIYDF